MKKSADLEGRIIDAVYAGASDLTELGSALELIAELFDATGAVLGEHDATQPERQFVIGVRTIDHDFVEDYAPYAILDPAPRAFAAAGKVCNTDQLFSPDYRRRNPFLNEFLLPNRIDSALGCSLFSYGGRFAQLAIHHGLHRKSFDDNDLARLERITPHLTRALQIRHQFVQFEARQKAIDDVIDRNPTGLVGLLAEGPALFVNRAACAFAAARDGLGLDRRGRPVVADCTAARRLTALEADVARGGPGGFVRVPRPSGCLPYVILVSRLPSGSRLFANSLQGILYAIHDPTLRLIPRTQQIADLLNLTLGAARVVEAILEGVELKEYAERTGITMNTVRFHLKNAFARTGTHSQAELVRVALSALGAFNSGPSREKNEGRG